jgi:hypothetical protein
VQNRVTIILIYNDIKGYAKQVLCGNKISAKVIIKHNDIYIWLQYDFPKVMASIMKILGGIIVMLAMRETGFWEIVG